MTKPLTVQSPDVVLLSRMRERESRAGAVWEPTAQPRIGVKPLVMEETARAVIDILRWGPEPGEPHLAAAGRKEMALRAVFAELSVVECLAVQRRFEVDGEDELALAFRRLVPERRARLIRYLQDLRRGRATT